MSSICACPATPESIDSGVPFQLLTHERGHGYVAPSGLIGPGGHRVLARVLERGGSLQVAVGTLAFEVRG